MDEILKANEYIKSAEQGVNGKYRLNYHMMPPAGWMNDPNGLIYFGGKYHLYYQFNPYDTHSGKMCWGHFESDDLISYTDCGVALYPEGQNASAFSGGAVECGGEIVIYYTLHTESGDDKSEEVYKAASADGKVFRGDKKVFVNETLPKNISRTDFRDPCPVKIGNRYYVFVGGKEMQHDRGVIIVLDGASPDNLSYEFYLGPYYELGDMGECPSYFRVGDKDIILASGCHVPERGNNFKNVNSSVFIVGNLDFERGKMKVDFIKEIDKGDTFYAPQFISGVAEPVMIGWLEMWNKPYPTRDMGHGWVGAFSVPRKLVLKDGDIFQVPVESLDKYCTEISGDLPVSARISLTFGGSGSVIIEGENGKVTIENDGNVYLDTRCSNNSFGSIRRTNGRYKNCRVTVLLDTSSVEVFVDGGREVISSRIYIDGGYSLKTQGKASVDKVERIGGKQ